MKVLLVGQAPSRTSDPERPFSSAGRSGRRLIELSGLSEAEFFRRVVAVNVIKEWPGWSGPGRGDHFPVAPILPGFFNDLRGAERVILAGRGVAVRLLGRRALRLPYLAWEVSELCWDGEHLPHAILPHPSGVNRWWNDPSNVGSARRFLRRALR